MRLIKNIISCINKPSPLWLNWNRLNWLEENDTPPASATAFVGELEIFIPMAGFINKEEETADLIERIAKLQKDVDLTKAKFKTHNLSIRHRLMWLQKNAQDWRR